MMIQSLLNPVFSEICNTDDLNTCTYVIKSESDRRLDIVIFAVFHMEILIFCRWKWIIFQIIIVVDNMDEGDQSHHNEQ
jgi:hypothetical protein